MMHYDLKDSTTSINIIEERSHASMFYDMYELHIFTHYLPPKQSLSGV